ncbi:helix-turn-helix domain-containing protein [Saccharopolyspora sp. NPDC000995]
MTAKLDYRWHLRKIMADWDMFQTTDLIKPLAQRDIELSSSQVYRLVVERPERLSLKVLMVLLDILDCTMDELIEPVPTANAASAITRRKKAVGADNGVGDLRPKRARIRGAVES